MQHKDTLIIWGFFGNDSNKWNNIGKKKSEKCQVSETNNSMDQTSPPTKQYSQIIPTLMGGNNYSQFNIR